MIVNIRITRLAGAAVSQFPGFVFRLGSLDLTDVERHLGAFHSIEQASVPKEVKFLAELNRNQKTRNAALARS